MLFAALSSLAALYKMRWGVLLTIARRPFKFLLNPTAMAPCDCNVSDLMADELYTFLTWLGVGAV